VKQGNRQGTGGKGQGDEERDTLNWGLGSIVSTNYSYADRGNSFDGTRRWLALTSSQGPLPLVPCPMSSLKRILVTGGAGFLGSHLCERLVALGHDVICLDNFFTSQKTNVSHLLSQPNFELIRHDVVHPIWLEVDEIYNLACPAAPGHYQFNPIKTLKTSVVGAINVLGMGKRCRAKVLQASTSEVYGDPEIHPQPEAYRGAVNPIGPRACYDEGKRAAETLFMDYHRMNRVNIRIARIFNTYGPRMHPFDGRVVSNFILQALEGKPLTIFGDGSQTRSFCYRDDLVEGLIRLMNAPDDVCTPVNIGNPDEFTILELAELVLELTGSKAPLARRPLPPDDPTKRRPDITLARAKLGWQPTVKLREGLVKTIEWFRSIDVNQYRAPTPNY
jgi:UDP-glucuronate decarboxylase